MKEIVGAKSELKKDWALSASAFRRLLEWLDGGGDSGGRSYLEIRRRLVAYFDRKSCQTPDELADETLNRVARRLLEEEILTDDAPARYCYIVAKFVFYEDLRRRENDRVSLDTLPPAKELRVAGTEEPDGDDRERLLGCLESCLQSLEPERRELILQYYGGERRAKIEGRRRLAERYGASVNALSIRACRIRQQLEKCVRACSEAGG